MRSVLYVLSVLILSTSALAATDGVTNANSTNNPNLHYSVLRTWSEKLADGSFRSHSEEVCSGIVQLEVVVRRPGEFWFIPNDTSKIADCATTLASGGPVQVAIHAFKVKVETNNKLIKSGFAAALVREGRDPGAMANYTVENYDLNKASLFVAEQMPSDPAQTLFSVNLNLN